MGCFSMAKGVPNKRYTPEFKNLVVETMMKEKLSCCETARRFEISEIMYNKLRKLKIA